MKTQSSELQLFGLLCTILFVTGALVGKQNVSCPSLPVVNTQDETKN